MALLWVTRRFREPEGRGAGLVIAKPTLGARPSPKDWLTLYDCGLLRLFCTLWEWEATVTENVSSDNDLRPLRGKSLIRPCPGPQ